MMAATNKTKKKPTVLIVDDDPSICRILEKILQKEGYNIMIVNSGKQAIKIVERETVQLILLDIQMNGIDGMDTLQFIKSISPDTNIIMMTAHPTLETARRAMEHYAYDYITKPFDVDFLTELIKKCLTGKDPS
ncbi:MAG: response regulator [Planctomycetota bacterium]